MGVHFRVADGLTNGIDSYTVRNFRQLGSATMLSTVLCLYLALLTANASKELEYKMDWIDNVRFAKQIID